MEQDGEIGSEIFQIVIVGKPGTGKTSLLNKLAQIKPSKYTGEIERHEGYMELINGWNHIMISEVDLPSIFSYKSLLRVIKADAVILIYATDDRESFDIIERAREYLMAKRGETASIIVIGNKSDIKDREVQFEVADCIVSIEWEMGYFETSAITGENVRKILPSLLKNVEHFRDDMETYEFKGVTIKRESANVEGTRGYSWPHVFSRHFSKSFSAHSSKKVDGTTVRNKFSFRSYLTRKSTVKETESGRSDKKIKSPSENSQALLLSCFSNNDQ